MIRRTVAAGADRPLSVDEVALRVRNLIDYDAVLARVAVEGELTDFKRHVSGHIYFSMKGQNASLSCVMFRGDAAGQLLWPSVGDRVCAVGSVKFYDARGTVQVYARKLFPLGEGAAARAKEELRRRRVPAKSPRRRGSSALAAEPAPRFLPRASPARDRARSAPKRAASVSEGSGSYRGRPHRWAM